MYYKNEVLREFAKILYELASKGRDISPDELRSYADKLLDKANQPDESDLPF